MNCKELACTSNQIYTHFFNVSLNKKMRKRDASISPYMDCTYENEINERYFDNE